MISLAVLTMVLAVLYVLAASLGRAAAAQEASSAAQDDARTAMMLLVREVRQAASSSIPAGSLPGPSLDYRIPVDLDGNGYAIDVGGNLELSGLRTFAADTGDVNNDDEAGSQLIRIVGANIWVVGNGLSPNEDSNANGTLDASEDLNNNGQLERGVWFEQVGQGIRITIDTQRPVGPGGMFMTTTLSELVIPRN